jgi:UDP-3-O-[3-hydroxymyristoyl] N-acetylglucosamine deacetylase
LEGFLTNQHTIARRADISGIGLHTGVTVNLSLVPAPANTGIVFRRTDLEGFRVEARVRHVAHVSYATSLMKKGVLISTTEHLLSALAASGIDNVLIDLDNLEVPIVDGSALPFLRIIQAAGVRRLRAKRSFVKVLRPVEVIDGAKRIAVYPSTSLSISYRIVFSHPAIGDLSFDFTPSVGDYEREIAPARTFGFLEEVEMLKKSGLIKGGSLENAVVLSREGVLNPEGLRFPDEFCRHKILDVIGDLALLGRPLIGHVEAERAGHAMHVALVERLLSQKDAWELVHSDGTEAPVPDRVAEEVATPVA